MIKKIKEIHSEFVKQTLLPVDWKQQLYSVLSAYKPEDLETVCDNRDSADSSNPETDLPGVLPIHDGGSADNRCEIATAFRE